MHVAKHPQDPLRSLWPAASVIVGVVLVTAGCTNGTSNTPGDSASGGDSTMGDSAGDAPGDGGDSSGPPAEHADAFNGFCGAEPGRIFRSEAPWNQSVRSAPVDPASDAIVNYLDAVVTGSQTFRIDMGNSSDGFGFNLLVANPSDAHASFVPRDAEDLFYRPHCDEALVPIPSDGRLEGETGYDCPSDGDCHLLVLDVGSCQLFEMWKADTVDTNFVGGCLAVWDVAAAPTSDLRGLSCTSADAAGLPIAPLLVTPGEIQSGEIHHALRFILPNAAVARDVYVRPATHNPLTVSSQGLPDVGPGGTQPPPYGVRLRLRADFDTAALPKGARVMAEALKEYGMFHADGGSVTFIASNSHYANVGWDDPEVALGPNDLRNAGLSWTDFEVVSDLSDTGSMMATSCSRTALDEF